jgi:hypothetical protein
VKEIIESVGNNNVIKIKYNELCGSVSKVIFANDEEVSQMITLTRYIEMKKDEVCSNV